jgi:sirohydrochlorin cobaltochelatase
VKDWRTLTTCPDVIVVPFFISDGLHSFEDIPVLLGLTHNIKEKGFTNPHLENGRTLWYATAIGTEHFIADVILAQVTQFQDDHSVPSSIPVPFGTRSTIENELIRFFEETPAPWKMGELAILPSEDSSFSLIHGNDLSKAPATLRRLCSPEDVRELIRLDIEGNFRPLRAAPNLRDGWIFHASNLADLLLALEYFYPAALANWSLQMRSQLPITPWSETAERQTGRFRVVREIDETALRDLVTCHCETGCLKQRLWPPAVQTRAAVPNEIPLFCPEACNFLVGKAREKLKGPGED